MKLIVLLIDTKGMQSL